jgi:translation initiation factor 2B subunit (eIF-2B alpha/beta/delta family)
MSLALAARDSGKPFVAVCSTSKLIPVLEMDAMEGGSVIDGMKVREAVFEITPLELVTAVITDEGVLSGEEMRKRLLKDRSNMKVTECQSC